MSTLLLYIRHFAFALQLNDVAARTGTDRQTDRQTHRHTKQLLQTSQLSRFWRETHAFGCLLRLDLLISRRKSVETRPLFPYTVGIRFVYVHILCISCINFISRQLARWLLRLLCRLNRLRYQQNRLYSITAN